MNKLRVVCAVLVLCVLIAPLSGCASGAQAESSLPAAAGVYENRSDIPEQYKWQLTDIYETNDAWESDVALLENMLIPQMERYKGMLDSRENVLACLDASEQTAITLENVYVYAYLSKDLNMADASAQAVYGKAQSIYQNVLEAGAYVNPELLSKDEAALKGYIEDPSFYKHAKFLNDLLEQKSHVLSEAEESLLSQLFVVAQSPNDIFSMLNNADLKFAPAVDSQGKEAEVSISTYGVLVESPDRNLRKSAFESLYCEYMKHNNTFAAALSAQVNQNIFFAKARKYHSALEASLGSDIPVSVYERLIEATNSNLEPLHRYMALRKEVLGLEALHVYDLYAPIVSEYNFSMGYDDAITMVSAALSPLGGDYGEVLQTAFASHWIDVYASANKESGAYSYGTYRSHPYVLMNYTDNFESVTTLAHELGHALHQYYSSETQSFPTAEASIFNAEVASTVNEIILTKYMINNSETDDEKLYYMDNLAELYRGAFYNQVMCAEFEQTIYEIVEAGGALTTESLNTIWLDLCAKYYGEAFEADELGAATWSRIPHFYTSFYVYQYATSITAANQLVTQISEQKPGALNRYIGFLKSGSQYDSITTLENVGVYMDTPQPTEAFVKEFDALVTEMERILMPKT